MFVKTSCIVLHRFAYSDSSWIIKALTQECGILSFILKGGKGAKAPFKGILDPLSLSEIVFRQSPKAELLFVKEANLLDWHTKLRENLLSQAKAQVMAEILLRYAPQGVPLNDEFSLFANALNSFDQEEGGVFAQWLLDTCDLWGYQLDLSTCSHCEKPLSKPAKDFHPESGGLICETCHGSETTRAKPETMLGLWHTHQKIYNIDEQNLVENALLSYLRNHIGFLKEIHSLQWLQEVRKLCSAPST
ncbi:MAG: DNA repair protein RecO [Fibrobacter sp.]|nr:DNA repair protein RecO [Fibrobacter sp.]